MALTEALKKSMSKLTGRASMFHKFAILFDLCINCYWSFSHNNHVSIDTFSREQLYSAHTEVSRPVVKHFQHHYHCWYQEDNVR